MPWALVNGRKKPAGSTARARDWLPLEACKGPVGFVVTGGVGGPGGTRLIGVDLDACRDPKTGKLSPWAVEVLKACGSSYTAISPSGTGLHTWVLVRELPEQRVGSRIDVHVDAPPGVEKQPQIQLFGLGPAGYMTCSGKVLDPRLAELKTIDNLDALFALYPELQKPDGAGDEVLPTGHGEPPTLQEIHAEVLQHEHGEALLEARWQEVAPDKSASDVFFMLETIVLRAARGHGDVALDFLLTLPAWSQGHIDECREPEKYGRESWVRRDLARANAKTPAASVFDVFQPLGGPEPTGSTGDARKPPAIAEHESVGDLCTAPPERDYLLHGGRGGFMPSGIVGILSSEGGVGKTNLLLQLAVSIVVGRPWLGFDIDDFHVGQRVLLVLAEETRIEVRRRLFDICEHLQLPASSRRLVEQRVIVKPLAGKVCSLISQQDGTGVPSENYRALRRVLHETDEPWALVGLDPLARLFPKAESDNELATLAVQMSEALVTAPGEPHVALAHHSSKMARRAGTVDARGVTGLTDAARMALTLRNVDEEFVELARTKGNYSAPLPGPLRLRRIRKGLLELVTEHEAAEITERVRREVDAATQEVAIALVAALQVKAEQGVLVKTKEQLRALLKVRNQVLSEALGHALNEGWVVKTRAGYEAKNAE